MNPLNFGTISFPSLGISVDPARGFSVGPLSIHYYGLIITLGLVLAVVYSCRRSKEFGVTEDDILDGVLWVAPFAILCARAYYCIFSWDHYAKNPISLLYIWEGGLAIYGGVLGAVAGVIVFCKIKKIKIATVLDLVLMGFLIGQSLGRWGNFFNREAFGAATDSFLRMGLLNKFTGSWEYYHPTFFYESVWNAAGFVLLHFLSKKRKFDGQIVLGYLAWYGLGRTFIEGLRLDSLYWGDFRVSQLLAACTCFIGVALLMVNAFRDHDPAKLQANIYAAKLAQAEEAAQEESADTQE